MAKKVLKIVSHEWGAASRDRKELAICRELGCEIVGMQKGGTKDKGRHEILHGFDVYNYSTRPLGDAKIFRPLNRFISIFTWAHYARKFKPDIISGHDYIALFIGWLSTTFIPKKKKPKLVYDSHEFELGRNKKRSKLALWFVKRIEGFLIRRCAFTIIPNADIADKLAEIYHVKRPVVARNIPLYWNIDREEIQEQHNAFCDALDVPHDTFLMMFHGGIMEGRGIEGIMRISSKIKIPLILLGNPANEQYYNRLKEYAKSLGAEQQILFHPAVPLDILWKYAGASNVGTIIVPGKFESYYHMLPNKFFENIQSLTPLIVSDFPDIGKIIDEYDIGLKVDPENEEDIISAILRMRDDTEMYAHFKANLVRAKEELCWENERMPLYNAYKEIINE